MVREEHVCRSESIWRHQSFRLLDMETMSSKPKSNRFAFSKTSNFHMNQIYPEKLPPFFGKTIYNYILLIVILSSLILKLMILLDI